MMMDKDFIVPTILTLLCLIMLNAMHCSRRGDLKSFDISQWIPIGLINLLMVALFIGAMHMASTGSLAIDKDPEAVIVAANKRIAERKQETLKQIYKLTESLEEQQQTTIKTITELDRDLARKKAEIEALNRVLTPEIKSVKANPLDIKPMD